MLGLIGAGGLRPGLVLVHPKSVDRKRFATTQLCISNSAILKQGIADDTTPPIKHCRYCGDELWTWGFVVSGGTLWFPESERCDCPQSLKDIAETNRLAEEEWDRQEAERKRKFDEQRKATLLAQSMLEERYRGKTFATWQTGADTRIATLQASVDTRIATETAKMQYFADNFERAVESGKGVFLHGPVGTGKTHLAAATGRAIVDRLFSVRAFSETDLMAWIRSTYNDDSTETERNLMRELGDVDLLIIDDIGKTKSSEWYLERLFTIIDTRYSKKKPVIVTSNYSLNDLEQRLARNAPNNDFTAKAIVSRLFEMCNIIELRGTDRRIPNYKGENT